MSSKMYVGNISFSTTESDLRALFSDFGQTTEVAILNDRETGRPRGFGFITMNTREEMNECIKNLDGREFQGRTLHVNEAKEREERPRTSAGGGRDAGNRKPARW